MTTGFDMLRKEGEVTLLPRALRSTDRLLVEDGLTDKLYYVDPALIGGGGGNVSAESFGAKGDGFTDNTASIQAAIDALAILGGGVLTFGPGVFQTGALLISTPHIRLRGIGGGAMFAAYTSGTVLQAKSGTVDLLTFTTLNTSTQAIANVGLDSILLDGAGVAARGLVVGSVTGGRFQNFRVQNCTTVCIDTFYGAGPSAGLKQTYGCIFDNFSFHAGTNGIGVRLGGEAAGAGGNRTTFCSFTNFHGYHENGNAFHLDDCDTNWFAFGSISRGAGTGFGFYLDGVDVDAQDLCENNQFHAVHAGFGGWKADGAQAIRNFVFGLSTTDGVPVSITNNAELFFIDDLGKGLGWKLLKLYDFAVDGAANNVTALNLGGYSRIMVVAEGVSLAGAVAGYRYIKVSSTNGANYEESGTEFYLDDANGVRSSGGHYIQTHFTGAGAARYTTVVIENFNLAGPKSARIQDGRQWSGVETLPALNALRYFTVGADFSTPVNIAGGKVYIYGAM